MKIRRRILLTELAILGMTFVFIIPVLAQKSPKGKAKPSPNLAARLFQLPPGMELNEEQKTKVASLIEEIEPKLAVNQKRILHLFTAEQRAARAAVFRKSRTDPDGKAMREDVAESINLTEEQKQQFSEIQDEKNEIKKDALRKFQALLSEEQKVRLQAAGRNRKMAR